LEVLELEKIGIFFGHLENITSLCYILWQIGNFESIWYIFPPFWYIVSRKIWQPWTLHHCRLR
jgi:hypothetical protein